jgi:large subunit ribosomal protein L25
MKPKSSSSQKLLLTVTPRTVFGKKLKKMRFDKIIPANIFGPDFKSSAISVPFKDFTHTYKVAKETGVVYLKLDKEEIPVLIKMVQHHPVSNIILHVDFRKIDLKKKIQTEVPVTTIGTSEAVSQKAGILLTQTATLLVEALPEDIPAHIEVDISGLKELGTEIKVADLPKSAKFEIKTPVEKVVVSVVAHKEESTVAETTVAAPEVLTEAKPEEGAEGAVAAEGATPAKPTSAKATAGKGEVTPAGKAPAGKPEAGKKEEKK